MIKVKDYKNNEAEIPRREKTLVDRLKLIWGGPRRYLLRKLKPEYVDEQLEKREGECRRCGSCCQMSWRCRNLSYDEDGLAICKIHGIKPRGSYCVDFPINEKCLNDRKLSGFDHNCGFSWPKNSKK